MFDETFLDRTAETGPISIRVETGHRAYDAFMGFKRPVPTATRPVPPGPAARVKVHSSDSGAIEAELDALGLDGARAEVFRGGRSAGVEAARRYGPVPDHVVDAIARMITAGPAVETRG